MNRRGISKLSKGSVSIFYEAWVHTSPLCEGNLAEDWRPIRRPRRSIVSIVVCIVVQVKIEVAAAFSVAIRATKVVVVVVILQVRIARVGVEVLAPRLEDLAQTGSLQHAPRREVDSSCRQPVNAGVDDEHLAQCFISV